MSALRKKADAQGEKVNVTINSQALAVELRLAAKIVPSKPVIPILSHVLLRADEGQLNIYATDLEVGLSTRCIGDVTAQGNAAVPAAKLLAMVEQFPDGDVNISVDRNQVLIKCGTFKSRLQTMRPDEFPARQNVEGVGCRLDAVTLGWLIGRTRHATASSAIRHVLQGALLKLTQGVAAMVSTDGKRLVLATAGRPEGPDMEFVVPAKTMDVLAGQLEVGDVELTKGPRHLFFSMGDRMLTSRTIDAQFPAYERIVPRQNDKKILFERLTLAAALRRVVLAAEENGAVYFNVSQGENGSGGRMELTAASAGVGSADEVLPVQYEGPPLKVCINGNYVLAFLDVASEQTMTMLLKDANSAALLQDGRECFSVIMLMRGN